MSRSHCVSWASTPKAPKNQWKEKPLPTLIKEINYYLLLINTNRGTFDQVLGLIAVGWFLLSVTPATAVFVDGEPAIWARLLLSLRPFTLRAREACKAEGHAAEGYTSGQHAAARGRRVRRWRCRRFSFWARAFSSLIACKFVSFYNVPYRLLIGAGMDPLSCFLKNVLFMLPYEAISDH